MCKFYQEEQEEERRKNMKLTLEAKTGRAGKKGSQFSRENKPLEKKIQALFLFLILSNFFFERK